MEEIPTQQVQDMVEQYCLYRPLSRPKTDLKRAVLYTVLFLCASVIVTMMILEIFSWQGISFFPHWVLDFRKIHPILFAFVLLLLVLLIMTIIFSRFILIGLVHLYQHYAPENIRRRCLLMPTCSEYMILAIKKYGVLIGVCKGIHRLFRTCKGNVYRIDYPYHKYVANKKD